MFDIDLISGWPSTDPLLSPCPLYRQLESLTGALVTRWKIQWSSSMHPDWPQIWILCCKLWHSCKLSIFHGQEIPGRSSVWNCDGEILEQPSLNVRWESWVTTSGWPKSLQSSPTACAGICEGCLQQETVIKGNCWMESCSWLMRKISSTITKHLKTTPDWFWNLSIF